MPPSVSLDHYHAHISRRWRRSRSHLPLYHARLFSVDFGPRGPSFRLSSICPDCFNFFRATCKRLSMCNIHRDGSYAGTISTCNFHRDGTHASSCDRALSERARRAHRLSSRLRRAAFWLARERRNNYFQLRAFQPQQHEHILSELELPGLLAPDLPSD